MNEKRAEWADELARGLARLSCGNPVEGENCGEIFVCGGCCTPCWARKYVERYPAPYKVPNESRVRPLSAPLGEGMVVKGGRGTKPTTPAPPPPKGQGGSDSNTLNKSL